MEVRYISPAMFEIEALLMSKRLRNNNPVANLVSATSSAMSMPRVTSIPERLRTKTGLPLQRPYCWQWEGRPAPRRSRRTRNHRNADFKPLTTDFLVVLCSK